MFLDNCIDIFDEKKSGLTTSEVDEIIRKDPSGIIMFNPTILDGTNTTNIGKIARVLNTPMSETDATKGIYIPIVLYGQSLYYAFERLNLVPALFTETDFNDRTSLHSG